MRQEYLSTIFGRIVLSTNASMIDTGMRNFLTTTLTPDTSQNEIMYRQLSFAIAWLTLALCIFGLFGNTCSIIIYSNPSMRSPINVLLLGTACIDFSLSFLSIPTFVIPGMYAYYKSALLHDIMAYVSAYVYPLTIMMQTASVWAFVVITFERWNAVCRPLTKARWSSIARSRIALTVVCALAISYNAVRFFEFRLEWNEFDEWTNETEGTVNVVQYLRDNNAYMNIYYNCMFLITHFAIPFTVLVLLNGFIIRTICESRKRRRQLNKKERSEHRTAVMMIIVVLTFICCYTLLFILNIVEAADPEFFYSRHMTLAFALNDISNVLVVTNAASTILVYYVFSQKYRELLINLLTKRCPCVGYLLYTAVPKDSVHSDGDGDGRRPVGHDGVRLCSEASALSSPFLEKIKYERHKHRPSAQSTAITMLSPSVNNCKVKSTHV